MREGWDLGGPLVQPNRLIRLGSFVVTDVIAVRGLDGLLLMSHFQHLRA